MKFELSKYSTPQLINNKFLALLIIFLFPLSIFLLKSNPFSNIYLLFVFVLPLVIILLLNVHLILRLLVLSFYLGTSIAYITAAEITALLLIISIITTQKFDLGELRNPILPYFILFLASILPSYFNSAALLETSILSLRILLFIGIFLLIPILIGNYNKIKRLFTLYILFALFNAIHIIYLAITTGKRVFGFSGIMYVDLVSLAIVISFIGFIYHKSARIRYGFATFILSIALIFTQTRGIWIVLGITLILIMIHSIFNSSRVGISRLKIVTIIIAVVFTFVAMVLFLQNVNPGTFERTTSQSVKSSTELASNLSNISSFATRFFIWTTAWNAFSAHPIIGIGFYSFPLTSQNYSTIDPMLYDIFVKNLTAHTSILSLLAEVGILGFMGFLFFLLKTLILAKNNIKRSKTENQWITSVGIFWVSIYISFSMIITDAWLWGTLFMLWGLILGLSIANQKLIIKAEQKVSKDEG